MEARERLSNKFKKEGKKVYDPFQMMLGGSKAASPKHHAELEQILGSDYSSDLSQSECDDKNDPNFFKKNKTYYDLPP